MGRPRLLSDSQYGEVSRLYSGGASASLISEQRGIPVGHVYKALKATGTPIRKRRYGLFTPQQRAAMLSMHGDGMSAYSIGKAMGASGASIQFHLRRAGLTLRPIKKYSCDEHFFDVIDTEEKAYWLGFLAADGCVLRYPKPGTTAVTLNLAETDADHVAKFALAVKATYPVHIRKHGSSQRQAALVLRSEIMVESLIRHGLVPRKTYSLKYPTTIPRNLQRHFIRGVIDGDGNLGIDRKTGSPYMSVLGTRPMIDGMRDRINNTILGAQGCLWHRSGPCWRVSYNGRLLVPRIIEWLYADASIVLQRKGETASRIIAYLH